MIWNTQKQEEEIDGTIPEAPPPYKEPEIKTEVLDLATEVENKKTYVPTEGDKKPFEKRKEEGFSMAPPVNIYEPGFRSDLYEAIINFWRQKKQIRQRNADLKEKMGWR